MKIQVCISICLCCLLSVSSHAQLQLLPSGSSVAPVVRKAGSTTPPARRADGGTLPFWDDFSYAGQTPNPQLWLETSTASVTNGIALNAPSWGTITLDGVQADGTPYATGSANVSGDTDVLQSVPLDLSAITAAEQASVYLSFYWQLQGAGDRPDLRDSLKLYFLDAEQKWHLVWSRTGEPGTDASQFQQQLISLQGAAASLPAGTNFFHAGFSFKFQSFSRQSGHFDQWHLDYVYLDKNRRSTDMYYKDVTISEGFTSLLQPYTAMPYRQFLAKPAAYLRPQLPLTAFNLENPNLKNKEDQALYQVNVSSELGEPIYSSEVITLTNSTPTGPEPIYGQQFMTRSVAGIPASQLEPFRDRDTLTLRATLSLNVQDGRPEFFRNNQLIVTSQLTDFFAYDDGSAELGLSLNGRGQRLVYRYVLEEAAHLTDVSLYSPYYNRSSAGQEINLLVFSALAGQNGATEDILRYSQRVTLPRDQAGLNEFMMLSLPSPQQLDAGEFFIGFEQLGANPLAVGFDINTDSREQIFSSVNGTEWTSSFQLEGSLMMRPHFRTDVEINPNGLPDHHFPPVRLYPNPASERLWVESEAQQLRLYDAQGRLVLQQQASPRTELFTGQLQPGIYLLQLQYPKAIQSKRILIIR